MGTLFSGVAALYYRLMDHSVEISVLICLIFILKWIAAKKLPAWWHYSLWLMLLVRMLVPMEFENRLNVYNFIPDIREHQVFEMIADSSFANEVSDAGYKLKSTPDSPDIRFLLKNILPVLWLAGAMVFGMCILFKSISFWRSIRRIPPISGKEVLHLLAECKNRMKIDANIDVIVTDKVRSPALFGYFHPRLLLPRGVFERLSDDDLSYAFMHELGHLKRHDIGISWVMAVLQAAYWFNPLVWLAFHQIRIDQETACDESVLSHIKRHQSADYAKAIVGFLEKFYQNCQLPSLAGVMENSIQMKRRITTIVHYRKRSRKLTVAAVALFISAGFVFYLFTGVAKEPQAPSVIKSKAVKTFAGTASGVDEMDIARTEVIPGEFFSPHAVGVPALLHVAGSDRSYTNGGAEEEKGASPEVQGAPANDPALSDKRIEVADAAAPAVWSKPAAEPKRSAPDVVSVNKTGVMPSADRVAQNTFESLLDPQHRAVKTGSMAVNGSEGKQGIEAYDRRSEVKIASLLSGSIETDVPAGEVPAVSSVKSVEESMGKKGVENNRNTTVFESGMEDSGRYAGSQETDAPSAFNRRGAIHQPVTVGSAAHDKKTAGAVAETLSGSEASHSMVKTDRMKNGERMGLLATDVDIPPRVIRAASPQYPLKAERDKITGYIKLRFVVTKDGNAIDTTVVESSPEGVFDKSALEAIESYRFKPGMKDGKAVDVQVSLPIKFKLS